MEVGVPQPERDFITCRICGERGERYKPGIGRICGAECLAAVNKKKKARFRVKPCSRAKETAYMRGYLRVWRHRRGRGLARWVFWCGRLRDLRRQVEEWERECAVAAREERRGGRLAVRRLRREVAKALGGKRCGRTADIVGYPMSALREWAVRNGYNPPDTHIDHIVPVSWWLARYPGDFCRAMRGAWNLGNLRVVSAAANIAKGARRDFLI